MKGLVIKIVVGVLGVGALGAGGYFAWRHFKGRKKPNEPVEVTYIPFKPAEKEPVMRDPDDKKTGEMDIDKKKYAKAVKNYVGGEDFETYLAGMESPEEDDDDDIDDIDDDISGSDRGPYLISAGEFCNNRTYYDKVSVNYFDEDDVVADDRDEVMDNADKVLGDLQRAFGRSDGSAVIYIRNEELEVDYEVSLVNGSYRKEVLHLDN